MKKKLALCLIGILSLSSIFSLEGKVITVTGKVEYQEPQGAWKPLKEGDFIHSGSMISTGFKSEASIQLGASILSLKPLTRMTLTELSEKEDTVDTELYLEVGTIKAEVNSFNNKKNGFTVKSPVATASVRGTIFEFGEVLSVSQGSVSFMSPIGQVRFAVVGDQLEASGDAVMSPLASIVASQGGIPLSTTPSTESNSPIQASTTNTQKPKEVTAEKTMPPVLPPRPTPTPTPDDPTPTPDDPTPPTITITIE